MKEQRFGEISGQVKKEMEALGYDLETFENDSSFYFYPGATVEEAKALDHAVWEDEDEESFDRHCKGYTQLPSGTFWAL